MSNSILFKHLLKLDTPPAVVSDCIDQLGILMPRQDYTYGTQYKVIKMSAFPNITSDIFCSVSVELLRSWKV